MASLKERKLIKLLREYPGKTAYFYYKRIGYSHNELISSFDKLSNTGYLIGVKDEGPPQTYYLFRDPAKGETWKEQLCRIKERRY